MRLLPMQIGIDFDGAGVWTTQRVVQFHLVILTGEKHESRAWVVVGCPPASLRVGFAKRFTTDRAREAAHTHMS
jgi:hypothetical protein